MLRLFQTLQARIILLIVVTAIPGLFGIFYNAYAEREKAINSAINQAINTARTHSKIQSKIINETRAFLHNLAQFDAVQQPSSEQCSRFLANVIKVNSNYVNLGVPDKNGNLLCNAQALKHSVNVYDRPYIKKALTTRSFSIGEFQIDRATKLTSINFAYPVLDSKRGNLVGVAVAVISLDWWNEILSESYLPINTVAYITDSQNKILATFPTSNNLLGTALDIQDNTSRYKNAVSEGYALLSDDPYQRVYVKHPMFDNGQHINITIGIPLKHVFENIDKRLLKTSLILTSVVLLFVCVSVWLIRRNVLIPIKTLLQSTKALAQGKEINNTTPNGSIELKKLQQRFTQMAKTRLDAEKKMVDSQVSLQKSRDMLASHIENTPLGCVTWNTDFICIDWNKSAESIFGFSKNEAIGKHASELVVPSELRDEIDSVFTLLLEGKKPVRKVNDNVTRLLETITCEWYSTPILDFSGNAISVMSLVQDITKNKRMEDKLRLSASVFLHAKEGIFITDGNANIIDVNKTFEEITGYSRTEVLGKNPNMFKSDKQSAEFYAELWASITNEGYWTGEIWNRRKNNEIYAQLLTISAVKDAHGDVQNYIAIFSDISESKQQQYRLEQMAHYDVLTSLPNRSLLAERLDKALLDSQKDCKFVAVVLLDLDGFKEINDNFDHSIGDELLVTLSKRFKSTLRDTDTISRFGGDEFVAVLANLEQANDFMNIVRNMLKEASKPVIYQDHKLKVSASIGVTVYPTDNTDADQLIRHADQAMYLAKQKGKNCFHLFDIESEDAIKVRHELLQRISRALLEEEFELYYQPKVNMRSKAVIGVEALIRWQHPERGLLAPNEFLPAIENHQISIEIGEWVIRESLRQHELWKLEGIDLKISVNISALQIKQRNFPSRLAHLLSETPHIPPSALQLEVLETSELGDINRVAEIMDKCVCLGIKFAIDDFGTGYSSLTYLRRLPAEVIKIDQSFVRDMLVDPEDETIVKGVIALAKSFNRDVIAEGVETREHGATLIALGCELAQGYGIARPMPANNLSIWLQQWAANKEWEAI